MPDSAELEKVETMYGVFHCRSGDLITRQLKQYSAHTRNELAMIGSLIEGGDNMIDVGAHIGSFSVPFARFNQGRGRIFAFEANPENYRLLIRNIDENGLRGVVIPTHAIVSDKENRFTMKMPSDTNTGMYYFMPDPEASAVETEAANLDEWHEHNESDTPINLIKIDVEGAEVAVLRSCRHLIERHKPVLYFEVNTEALARFNNSAEDIESILEPLEYHFFRNIGARNSDHDRFRIARLKSLRHGGNFFDAVGFHASSSRYPQAHTGTFVYGLLRMRMAIVARTRRMIRRVWGVFRPANSER